MEIPEVFKGLVCPRVRGTNIGQYVSFKLDRYSLLIWDDITVGSRLIEMMGLPWQISSSRNVGIFADYEAMCRVGIGITYKTFCALFCPPLRYIDRINNQRQPCMMLKEDPARFFEHHAAVSSIDARPDCGDANSCSSHNLSVARARQRLIPYRFSQNRINDISAYPEIREPIGIIIKPRFSARIRPVGR